MSGNHEAPRATRLIRSEIRKFMDQPDPNDPTARLRNAAAAVYAFYDFDEEPIYVGQTSEGVGTRIGRHLTGQRSDAVAKFVLDPFEVAWIAVWTLPHIAAMKVKAAEKRRQLNPYESTVYQRLRDESMFKAVLNEAVPEECAPVDLPTPVRGRIIPDELWEDRAHKDVRIARRAAHVGRLSQLISERQPSPGLRRTLHLQAQRLEWLSNERLAELGIPQQPKADEQLEITDED
ncbi:GIY-YIG nuclease family protein [Streptomyces sp. MUM 178J]|uniref:GIY-YIG nuclease family protein n=1 Tax=Streptomyces sp. MUM 178J TaxID=2791991 RepID=UPI001F03A26F|nr:GIY-YIG nuclease family protein [Streptomyces sp. MUM 178J]WRQ79583.1 GIY-YIG nuclease family protein [Streptomyces sp. MUM 178J]